MIPLGKPLFVGQAVLATVEFANGNAHSSREFRGKAPTLRQLQNMARAVLTELGAAPGQVEVLAVAPSKYVASDRYLIAAGGALVGGLIICLDM